MGRTWYHRWLYSFMPAFLLVVSALVIIFFLALSDYARQEAVKANKNYGEFVLQSMDYTLQSVNRLMIDEILTNDLLHAYFSAEQVPDPYVMYELSQEIKEWINFPLVRIDSIYLYRVKDGLVLSDTAQYHITQFSDRPFLERRQGPERELSEWSGLRSYKEFNSQEERDVISLVKNVPLNAGSQGVMVFNLDAASLAKRFQSEAESDISFMMLNDRNGNRIAGTGAGQVISSLHSDSTGLTVRIGMKQQGLFLFFSAMSKLWVVGGLVCILLGVILMIYVIRRNYQPLAKIINRIAATGDTDRSKRNSNEFDLIESTIDSLLREAKKYEKEAEEGLHYRKKVMFQELMEGKTPDSPGSNPAWMPGWADGNGRYMVFVVEIDQYESFDEDYSYRDQNLFKYVLVRVIEEMAENEAFDTWTEWLERNRLAVIMRDDHSMANDPDALHLFCELFRKWVEAHLNFTVTVGLGGIVDTLQAVSACYEDAVELVKAKLVLEGNRIIAKKDLHPKQSREIFEHLKHVRLLASQYRLGQTDWDQYFEEIFHEIRQGIHTREEIVNLMNYLLYYFFKEFTVLSEPYRLLWENDTLPELNQILDRFETLEELRYGFYQRLKTTFRKMSEIRETKSHYQLIQEAKLWIEAHYGNPELSLVQISETFEMTPTYFSRLFKEEVGEKFVDYLVKVRVKHAKELLKSSGQSVQDIANQVGYIHPFSFIRVFKKLEGKTPGEYRKGSLSENDANPH